LPTHVIIDDTYNYESGDDGQDDGALSAHLFLPSFCDTDLPPVTAILCRQGENQGKSWLWLFLQTKSDMIVTLCVLDCLGHPDD
jgi:hypothetical protein